MIVRGRGSALSKMYEFSIRTPEGEEVWLKNLVQAKIEGDIRKRVGILLDVTQEKKASRLQKEMKELQVRQKVKSDFFANMSHEIRTPLNGVIGLGQLLLDTPLTFEQKEYTKSLVDCANSLLCLINDVLDLSKLEANMMSIHPTSFNLQELVNEAIQVVAIKAHEKDIELLLSFDFAIPRYVVGDPTRIRQVLVNFLGNAVKFTGTGGQIVVDVRYKEDGSIMISVTDNGIGIPAEKLQTIFGRFSQAESNTSQVYGGYGLGLDICQNIVSLMKGKIGVESQVGKGSTFWYSLPLPADSSSSYDSEGLSENEDMFPRDSRVLVIDPSKKYCEIMVRTLESWGLEAGFTHLVNNALEQLETRGCYNGTRFSLYIVTIWGEEQLTLINSVLRKFPLRTIKVMQMGRILGKSQDDEVLLKPLSMTRLLNSVKKLLNQPPPQAEEPPARPLPAPPSVLTPAPSMVALSGPSKRSSGNLAESKVLKRGKYVLNILVADDDNVNRMVASKFLTSLGCQVVVANNGLKALEEYSKGSFDIVFMDCQMPVMDGLEATRKLRELEMSQGRGSVPVIAFTGSDSNDAVHSCYAAGMNGFVTKPITRGDFDSLLQQYVEHRNNYMRT